jgi:hypothetical protein
MGSKVKEEAIRNLIRTESPRHTSRPGDQAGRQSLPASKQETCGPKVKQEQSLPGVPREGLALYGTSNKFAVI